MQSGIYEIINVINGKIYIGSSYNIIRREKEHFRCLKNGNHPNEYLQNSVNKYGIENFIFKPICFIKELCMLRTIETWYINERNSMNYQNGYNIMGVKEDGYFKHSEETKEKIRKGNLGKIRSLEYRKNMSNAKKGYKSPFSGKHHLEETKQLTSKLRKGKATSSLQKLIEVHGEELGTKKYYEYKLKIGKKRKEHHGAKKCIIDDITYDCAKDASDKIGVYYANILYRIKSLNYKNYNWKE